LEVVAISFIFCAMLRTFNYPPAALSELDAKPTLNVVIAYEDFETGKHAKGIYDFLVDQLGSEFHFLNQMWKFEVLSIPKLREMAAKDVVMADIIILSSRGGELSLDLKSWIESWVTLDGNLMAMVALFTDRSGDAQQTNAAREYLSAIAKRARLEFFAQPDHWPGKNSEGILLNRSLGSGQTLSALAGAVERETYPRWGINE
jgi:hypothetical protein